MRAIIILFVMYTALCDASNDFLSVMDRLEKKRMVGVETIHDPQVKINKDTIITRNTKMHQKKKKDDKKEGEPDWTYSAIPNEISAHVQQFKRNMTECLKEVQAQDKRKVQQLSPKKESPVHGECLIACVLKRNGVIEKGKINKGNLINLVGKFYAKDTKVMKKLEKNVDHCISSAVHDHDECTMAAKLNDCTNGVMSSNKHKVVINY